MPRPVNTDVKYRFRCLWSTLLFWFACMSSMNKDPLYIGWGGLVLPGVLFGGWAEVVVKASPVSTRSRPKLVGILMGSMRAFRIGTAGQHQI